MAAMADVLPLRLRSSSYCLRSNSSQSTCFISQSSPPASSSFSPIHLQLNAATRYCGCAANLATLTRRCEVRDLRRLCASQHVGGGSVERNDAAATGPAVKPEAKWLLTLIPSNLMMKLTAEEAVEAQMNALAHNDQPRPDHGLEVMYHFANSEGALNGGALSQYFGFASDLYHFGHFALKFKSRYPELICHNGYEVVSIQGDGEDHCEIKLKLTRARNGEDSEWVFSLSKSRRGVLAPCWLTSSLLKLKEKV